MAEGGGGQRPGTGTGGRVRGRSDNLVSVANRLKTSMYVSDRAMPPEGETVASIQVRRSGDGGGRVMMMCV